MRITRLLSVVFFTLGVGLFISVAPASCKKKVVATPPAPTDSQTSLLKTGEWQGNGDDIDPSLGQVKTLD